MRITSASQFSYGGITSPRPAAPPVDASPPVAVPVQAIGPAMGKSAVVLVVAGVCYNAVLALLNAKGVRVGLSLVILSELAILGAAGLALLRSGFRRTDAPALMLFAFFLVDACLVSLLGGSLFIDMARNAAIIAIFFMVGSRVSERTVRTSFAIVATLVFAVLALEIVSVDAYARLLEPASYFQRTRGMARFELDEIGLFANALGFEGRFSLLAIVGHRTASLFLEQVSLANFGTVLTIFLVALWPRLSRAERVGYPLLIALILVTNNSRTALGMTLIAPLVYLAAPRLPRFVPLGVAPVVLIAAWLVFSNTAATAEDTLVGRIGVTMGTLAKIDLPALLGARAPQASAFADSGYTYLVYAGSILALLVLWFFFSLALAQDGAMQKRCNLMLGVFLFGNLLIGGTAVFTIKIAALLWMLAGFVRGHARADPDLRSDPARRPNAERTA